MAAQHSRAAGPPPVQDAALNGDGPDDARGCASDDRPMMDPERQEEVLLRLAKAAGQVQGVSRRVVADRHCVDVLNQVSAVQKALVGVARVITRNYLERCVTDATRSGDPRSTTS